MHLCRDRGFPDLLQAVRWLLGWENAHGAEERDFLSFSPRCYSDGGHPHSQNLSHIGVPFSYYLSDLGQGYSRLDTSRPLISFQQAKRTRKNEVAQRPRDRGSREVKEKPTRKKSPKDFYEVQVYRGCPYHYGFGNGDAQLKGGDAHITVTWPPTFLDLAGLTFLHSPLTFLSRYFYYSRLPITRTNFRFPSGHFLYNFTFDNSNYVLSP